MECQDEMEEMESQEAKGRGETLVYRDHLACKVCRDHPACRDQLACKVCMHFDLYTHFLSSNYCTIKEYHEMNFISLH